MEIRAAIRGDLPAIVRLLADDPLGATRELYEAPLPTAYAAAFEAMERQGGHHLLLAVIDDAVVGCLHLALIPGLTRLGMTRAQIEGVRVDGARRGAGIGRALMAHAIELAREAGCGLVQLTTDKRRPEAHVFYESLGFKPSHSGMKMPL